MDRKELIEMLTAKLQQLDLELDKLENKSDGGSSGAQGPHSETRSHLRGQMGKAQEKLKKLETCSDDDWNALREGVEKALDEIDTGLKAALS